VNHLSGNIVKTCFIILITCSLSVFSNFSLVAQFYNGSNQTFGKNRVQFNNFHWTYYKFRDIDTYFYLNGKELAQYTARYASKQIPQIETKLGSLMDKKIQFIIFNNLTDLKQSNIGLMTNEDYNVGGITHIIGSKVFLYFDGNHVNFEEQIRDGIAEVMFNQMMFGGSVGQQVKTSTFFSLPDWYKVGIVSWLGTDWSVEYDNRVRDGILSGRYDKVNNITGEDAVYAGHSLWRFIAQRYGKATVSNIIHMTNMSNSIDKGFMYVTGLPFRQITMEWLEFYQNQYSEYATDDTVQGEVLKVKYKSDIRHGQPHINPSGDILAYTTNEFGKYKIYLYNLTTGKRKKIFKRGVTIDTKTDYSYPLLAWHPTGKLLTFIIEDKGMPWFYRYNIEEKEFTKQIIYNVQKITDFGFSNNGQLLVMSAVQNGQSDLFVYNIAASSFTKITDDVYSELNPRFINNSSEIVFSSNRENDTIGKEPELIVGVPHNFDLFVYDYANRKPVLKQITNTPLANEIMPDSYAYNTISYLSDETGIYNSYLAVIDSSVRSVDTSIHYRYFTHNKAITNYSRDIKSQHVSTLSGKKTTVIFNDNIYKIYIENTPHFSSVPALSPDTTHYMKQLVKKYRKEQKEKELSTQDKEINPQSETEEVEIIKAPRYKRFVMVYKNENGEEVLGTGNPEMQGEGNGQYVYDNNGQVSVRGDDEITIPKRLNYNVSYFINDLVSQVDFNYINYSYQPFTGGSGPIYLNPGFNIFFQVGMNDIMEDHRFVGGVRLNLNLINNEYIFSYANLKQRLDKEVVFHRNTLEGTNGYTIQRVHTHEAFYILKWPFNEALSIRGTAMYRNDMYVTLATDQINLETPNRYNNWAGIKGELVFDNTRDLGINLLSGTRYKFFAEYHQLLQNSNSNLVVLGFDYRNYQKIHRTFIWANRIAGSTSLGSDKLIYYMGGVDNWLFPKFNMDTPIDYTQNYSYQTLATNMRGFNQNIRNGNSFVVINSELRFPIFQYFSKTPISSGFLRSFQFVGFGDIGTAWTGISPYSPENSLFTNYVDSGPMHISVEVQKEPIVGGFGVGARAIIMGYFVRGDVSWGVDDYRVRKPVYYLSLSLDF
jgi:Tol biopolymer transport system component